MTSNLRVNRILGRRLVAGEANSGRSASIRRLSSLAAFAGITLASALAAASPSECDTATAWTEQVAPGVSRSVCGDDWGNELIGNSAEAYSVLRYEMALVVGEEPDSAYEDAYSERASEERAGRYAIEPVCRVSSEDSSTAHCTALEAKACYTFESTVGGYLETDCKGPHRMTGAELRCYELGFDGFYSRSSDDAEDTVNRCLNGKSTPAEKACMGLGSNDAINACLNGMPVSS